MEGSWSLRVQVEHISQVVDFFSFFGCLDQGSVLMIETLLLLRVGEGNRQKSFLLMRSFIPFIQDIVHAVLRFRWYLIEFVCLLPASTLPLATKSEIS